MNYPSYLKIKVTSLSEEIKQIRRMELKKVKWAERARKGKATAEKNARIQNEREGLYLHRIGLKNETRSAHIAASMLRGRSYSEIENFSWVQPDWNRVQRLVEKYSGMEPQVSLQRFAQWKDEALEGFGGKVYSTDKDNRDTRKLGSRKMVDEWTTFRQPWKPVFVKKPKLSMSMRVK
jgi:hypothetical protein